MKYSVVRSYKWIVVKEEDEVNYSAVDILAQCFDSKKEAQKVADEVNNKIKGVKNEK